MNTWAKPGVHCVCVNDAWWDIDTLNVSEPPGDVGTVYRIVSVRAEGHWVLLGLWGQPLDTLWDAGGFQPVVYPEQSVETDIALFTKIADRVPAPKKRDGARA